MTRKIRTQYPVASDDLVVGYIYIKPRTISSGSHDRENKYPVSSDKGCLKRLTGMRLEFVTNDPYEYLGLLPSSTGDG
jgi:hypothetical protein